MLEDAYTAYKFDASLPVVIFFCALLLVVCIMCALCLPGASVPLCVGGMAAPLTLLGVRVWAFAPAHPPCVADRARASVRFAWLWCAVLVITLAALHAVQQRDALVAGLTAREFACFVVLAGGIAFFQSLAGLPPLPRLTSIGLLVAVHTVYAPSYDQFSQMHECMLVAVSMLLGELLGLPLILHLRMTYAQTYEREIQLAEAEASARASQAQLQLQFQASRDLLLSIEMRDGVPHITRASNSFLTHLGHPIESVSGDLSALRHVFHAADLAGVTSRLAASLVFEGNLSMTDIPSPNGTRRGASAISPTWEQVMLHADGRPLWFEHQLSVEQIGADAGCGCAVLVSQVHHTAALPT